MDRKVQETAARRLFADLDPAIDVTAKIRDLRLGQRQIVGIAKALRTNARIIAMDEPIASLTPAEIETLAAVPGRLTARGGAIIHVSHKRDAVVRRCQSARILRDGRLISQVPIPETSVARGRGSGHHGAGHHGAHGGDAADRRGGPG